MYERLRTYCKVIAYVGVALLGTSAITDFGFGQRATKIIAAIFILAGVIARAPDLVKNGEIKEIAAKQVEQ